MDFQTLKEEFHKQEVTMTPEERRRAYLRGERVDFLPFALNGIDLSLADNLGYTTSEMARNPEVKDKIVDFRVSELGIDDELCGINFAGIMGSEVVVQEHGTAYIKSHFLKDYEDFDKLPKINAGENPMIQGSVANALSLRERHPDIRLRIIGNGPWSAAAKIRQVDMLLRDIRKNKDKLIDLLKFSNNAYLKFIEYFNEKVGQTPVFLTDPVTCMDLLSYKQFFEYSLPYLEEYVDEIYKITGEKPGLHICGHTKEMWKDIGNLNIGFFGVDNLEDIEDVKNEIGHMVAISGNVPPLEIFRDGSIDEVIEATKDCIRKAADSPKGFLIDAGCQMPLGVPLENLYAYIYAIRKYGAGAKIGDLPKGLKDNI